MDAHANQWEELLVGAVFNSCENDDKVSAITALVLLLLGCKNDELGGRVLNLELLDDGCSIVCDEEPVQVVDNHFVHAIRSKRCLGNLGNVFASLNVSEDGFINTGVVLCARLHHGGNSALRRKKKTERKVVVAVMMVARRRRRRSRRRGDAKEEEKRRWEGEYWWNE